MNLDVSASRFPLSMENQESHTTPSTRLTSKDQMEKEKTGTLHGLAWQFRIHKPSFMTASGGIQKKNSFGLTNGLFHYLIRVFVSTKRMLVWLRNGAR